MKLTCKIKESNQEFSAEANNFGMLVAAFLCESYRIFGSSDPFEPYYEGFHDLAKQLNEGVENPKFHYYEMSCPDEEFELILVEE